MEATGAVLKHLPVVAFPSALPRQTCFSGLLLSRELHSVWQRVLPTAPVGPAEGYAGRCIPRQDSHIPSGARGQGEGGMK